MIKHKRKQNNLVIVVCFALILVLLVILAPLEVFGATTSEYKAAKELNNTIIEELNEIDFSGLNEVVLEFNNNKSNIFSLENIKNKIYSIISGENAVNFSSFFASLFSNSLFLLHIVNILRKKSLILF